MDDSSTAEVPGLWARIKNVFSPSPCRIDLMSTDMFRRLLKQETDRHRALEDDNRLLRDALEKVSDTSPYEDFRRVAKDVVKR